MRDSIWSRTLPAESREALLASDRLPKTAEIAVVGAGLVGLCAAHALKRRGAGPIVLLDRATVCGEASGASAGGLWPAHESASFDDPEIVRQAADGHAELRREFPCDYVRSGLLELLAQDSTEDGADRVARTREAGFEAELLAGAELARCEPLLRHEGAAIHFPGDGSIHPLKLAAGIAAWLRSEGVSFCLGSEVRTVSAESGEIMTDAGRVSAGRVVIAAGAWTPLLTRMLGWNPPIRPLRGTLLATETQPSQTLRNVVLGPDYYYWQLASGPLAGGGSVEDVGFREGLDEAVVDSIRQRCGELFPALGNVAFTSAWTGFRPHCEDMNPAIGPVPGHDRVFASAGHFRKGVLLAPLSGKLLAQQMLDGTAPEWAGTFSPARFRPASAA